MTDKSEAAMSDPKQEAMDLLAAAVYLEADGASMPSTEADRIARTLRSLVDRKAREAAVVGAAQRLLEASHHSSRVEYLGDDDPWGDLKAALAAYEGEKKC